MFVPRTPLIAAHHQLIRCGTDGAALVEGGVVSHLHPAADWIRFSQWEPGEVYLTADISEEIIVSERSHNSFFFKLEVLKSTDGISIVNIISFIIKLLVQSQMPLAVVVVTYIYFYIHHGI